VKKGEPNIEAVIDGKLNFLKMVKGEEDSTYLKLKSRFGNLTDDSVRSNYNKRNLDEVLDTILNKGLDKGIELYQRLRKS
jgi:hypothetical protein